MSNFFEKHVLFSSVPGSCGEEEPVLSQGVHRQPQQHLHYSSAGLRLHPGRRHGDPRSPSAAPRHRWANTRCALLLRKENPLASLTVKAAHLVPVCLCTDVLFRGFPPLVSDGRRHVGLSVRGDQLLCDAGQTQCLPHNFRPGLRLSHRQMADHPAELLRRLLVHTGTGRTPYLQLELSGCVRD